MPVRSSTLWIHSYMFREGKQRIKNHDYEHFFTFVFTHRETRLSTKWVLVSTLLIYLTYRVGSVGNSVQCCVMYSTVLCNVQYSVVGGVTCDGNVAAGTSVTLDGKMSWDGSTTTTTSMGGHWDLATNTPTAGVTSPCHSMQVMVHVVLMACCQK